MDGSVSSCVSVSDFPNCTGRIVYIVSKALVFSFQSSALVQSSVSTVFSRLVSQSASYQSLSHHWVKVDRKAPLPLSIGVPQGAVIVEGRSFGSWERVCVRAVKKLVVGFCLWLPGAARRRGRRECQGRRA